MLGGAALGEHADVNVDPFRFLPPSFRPYSQMRGVWALIAVGLGLLVFFDLGPPLAFNDDWTSAWAVRHFSLLHPRLYPAASALALVQITWAWLTTLGHPDERLLRLSVVPFVLLAMYMGHRLARLLGSNPFWAAMAALAPLACPVFMADATTFMTDVPYVALMMTSALGGVLWIQGRRGFGICLVFATLATLQRQIGVVLPAALTAAFLLAGHLRPPGRRPFLLLGLLWAACGAAVVLPTLVGLTPPTQANRLQAVGLANPPYALTALLFLPGSVGLGLLVFLPGLALTRVGTNHRDHTGPLVFGLVLIELLVFFINGYDVFPGNVFIPRSLNWTGLPGLKPQIFPAPAFLVLEAAAVATAALLALRWRRLSPARLGPGATLLLLVAGSQLVPLMLLTQIPFDRYYLPVVAVLAPLAAAAATPTRPQLAAGLSLGLAAACLLVYAVGEQDYQAWQVARDESALLAYRTWSPYDVMAGYEAQAAYVEVPYYERTGRILSGVAKPDVDYSLHGPMVPLARLEFAAADDPRPGYTYRSLAPGKVVIVSGDQLKLAP